MAYFEFARAILADEPIAVFNHGRMSRAFTCIDDIVDPLLAVLDAPPMVAACPTLRYACCTLGAVVSSVALRARDRQVMAGCVSSRSAP